MELKNGVAYKKKCIVIYFGEHRILGKLCQHRQPSEGPHGRCYTGFELLFNWIYTTFPSYKIYRNRDVAVRKRSWKQRTFFTEILIVQRNYKPKYHLMNKLFSKTVNTQIGNYKQKWGKTTCVHNMMFCCYRKQIIVT